MNCRNLFCVVGLIMVMDQSSFVQGQDKPVHIRVPAGRIMENGYAQLVDSVPALDIFAALGQSNMAGRAPITPAVSDTLYNVLLFVDTTTWTYAVNPMNKYSNIRKDLSYQQVSPSYSFVKTLAQYTDRDIGIVVNARGGVGIAEFARGQYRNPIFNQLSEAAEFGEIKAIIWHQGESDNSNTTNYMNDLKLLVGDLREEFGDAYFVAGQMGGWYIPGTEFEKFGNINYVISTIPDQIENADFVTNEYLGNIGDGTHFNLESQILLGQRYARKVLRVVYGVDISITRIEMAVDGYAVFRDDTIHQGSSWSYTDSAGMDRTVEVFADSGEFIRSLVINGEEVNDVANETRYAFTVNTSQDTNLSIELTSGWPVNVDPVNYGTHHEAGRIYPNPAKNEISIRSERIVRGGVKVYSLQGTRVLCSREHEQVDVSFLPAGSYIVSFDSGGVDCWALLVKY